MELSVAPRERVLHIRSVAGQNAPRDLHHLAEERSRALHAEIALRVAADPSLVRSAVERIATWEREGRLSAL